MAEKLSREELIDRLEASSASMVRVAVVDIDGVLRGKYMHMAKFMEAVESGFDFNGGLLSKDVNDNDRQVETSVFADATVEVDVDTFRHVPWDNSVPFFLGRLIDQDREPLSVCPRQILRRIESDAQAQGFVTRIGLEFEFYNFFDVRYAFQRGSLQELETISTGDFGYSVVRASQQKYYVRRIMEDLEAFGVPIEGLHTLSGPGAYEASTIRTNAMDAGDYGALFKTGVKEIATENGVTPTFMAKWSANHNGSSCHLHQSLWSDDGEHNLFYDETRQYRMSSTFESYLAGQLLLLPDLMPFYAPTVNSYKRLGDESTPTHATWGSDHHAPALRVIPGSSDYTRLENRVSGADVNPYLAISAALGSGLYGIKRGLSLNDGPVSSAAEDLKDSTPLPGDLLDATRTMRTSDRAREIFGESFIDYFADTRAWEWQQAQSAVTDWEVRRYFEVI